MDSGDGYRTLCVLSCSVASDSLRPHGLLPTRLLCPWDFPGKNTGVGCLALLQGIFLALGSQADSLPMGRPTQHHGCTKYRRIRPKCLIPCNVHPPSGGPPRPPLLAPGGSALLPSSSRFIYSPSRLSVCPGLRAPRVRHPWAPYLPLRGGRCALSCSPPGYHARPGPGAEKERDPLGGAPVRNRRGLP